MNSYTLSAIQDTIKQSDFNPELKQAYFLKLVEEVGELSEVIRKDIRMANTGTIKGTIEEELYDVLYYVIALANLYEVDLEEAMRLKKDFNKQRYQK
jgi:NTP pyrophosphatase (non-canonical NTP hydrolase)